MRRHFQNKIAKNQRKHRPWWATTLIVSACVVGGLVILAAIALWIVVGYFSPARITRLIEEKSSEYLEAQIHIGKLDYKIFRSYPWLNFEVDSLSVVSKSLDDIPDSIKRMLPSDYEFLAYVESMKGQVNVHDLIHHDLVLKNLTVDRPKVNIVIAGDSLANFNIAPNMPHISKKPEIHLSEINVEAPVLIDFFSLPAEVSAKLDVTDFLLINPAKDRYRIGFKGDVAGRYSQYELPGVIPVSFDTGVKINCSDLSFDLSKLSLSVAGVSLDADGDINVGKKGISLKNAELNLSVKDIFALFQTLPEPLQKEVVLPDEISGYLPIELHASVPGPYSIVPEAFSSFSLSSIPEFSLDVRIPEANLKARPKGEKPLYADDIYFEARCDFNLENPEASTLVINQFRMNGEGIALAADARIEGLAADTQVISGNVEFRSPVMKTLTYFFPKSAYKISGLLDGKVSFNGVANNLGQEGFRDLKMKGKMKSHTFGVNGGGADLRLKNMVSDFTAIIPQYPLKDYSGTKLGLDFKADTLKAKSGGADIKISKFNLFIDAIDTVSGNPDPEGDLLVQIGALSASSAGEKLEAKGMKVKASGNMNSKGLPNYNTVASTTPGDDAQIARKVKHTPLVLEYSGGGILQTVMSMLNLDADICLESGRFESQSYLYPVEFKGVDLSSNLNDVEFKAQNVKISDTGFEIKGKMTGLEPFLTSYSATPLKAEADINFSNVNINRLSWGYYGSLVKAGKDSVFYVAPLTPFTASDSVCVAIPRNIDASIRLRSDSAEYMQYKFAPLSTDIIVKNGNATLSQLTIGAPYCTAVVDWTYSTQNLANVFMDLKAKVNDFRFYPFYKVFPQLIRKTPELKYLTGVVNADISCYFDMFPDMFMNAESLKGKFDIKGSDLLFAREGKIEKITHLMLIEGDAPIRIENLDINGSYHDNLLQLNPFKVRFDDYQLEFAGVNNTAGDMYYHISLEKSPFHVPFGVSLFGKMNHPQVRLGGTHIDDYRAESVSSDVASKINVNIMAWLHHGWLLFVQEAAKYEGGIE